jgi:hypothetical protein
MPLATVFESQLKLCGDVVSVATTAPLTRSSTLVTPTLSVAATAMGMSPLTVTLADGDVMDAVGGCESTVVALPSAARAAAAASTRPCP